MGTTSPSPETPPASHAVPRSPAELLGTPARPGLLPDCVVSVFHRGRCDLESSRRDATLALILAVTN